MNIVNISDSLAHRMDNRTLEEFEQDIKKAVRIEREIIERYAKWVKKNYGREIVVEDNGCDNTGRLLEKADASADFTINSIPVEVKFNNNHLEVFHIKTYQLKSYIEQNAYILWVNGYTTNNPVFTIVSPRQLKQITKTCKVVRFKSWGGKPCYRISASMFKWLPFNV